MKIIVLLSLLSLKVFATPNYYLKGKLIHQYEDQQTGENKEELVAEIIKALESQEIEIDFFYNNIQWHVRYGSWSSDNEITKSGRASIYAILRWDPKWSELPKFHEHIVFTNHHMEIPVSTESSLIWAFGAYDHFIFQYEVFQK